MGALINISKLIRTICSLLQSAIGNLVTLKRCLLTLKANELNAERVKLLSSHCPKSLTETWRPGDLPKNLDTAKSFDSTVSGLIYQAVFLDNVELIQFRSET